MNFEALFLGPHAENREFFMNMLEFLINEHFFWRRNFHPEDRPSITLNDQQQRDFLETQQRIQETLLKLSARLRQASMPWHSPRYLGHMNMDLLMPAVLAYMGTMLYNPNNVASEASPATSLMEKEVGEDLCRLFGFDPDKGYGHITSGGTVANFEGLWAARTIKAAGCALKELHIPLPQNYNGWDLCDLPPTVILEMVENIEEDQWNNFTEQLKQKKSLIDGDDPGYVLVPQSRHYSWDKAIDVLGLGPNRLIKIPVDNNFRMDINALRTNIQSLIEKKKRVLMVVGVLGSTEESAVDPIDQIIELRKEIEEKHKKSFYFHIDAAYGGYIRTLFLNSEYQFMDFEEMKNELHSKQIIAREAGWPSEAVYNAYRVTSGADSITIDPHKMGLIPYPAGAIAFKNSIIKRLLSYFAPYVTADNTMLQDFIGPYIMEGSKPGAAAAAVWAAHRVVPLNIDGYGKFIGESIAGARLLNTRLQEAFAHDNNFNVAVLTEPDLNILVYAFNRRGNMDLDRTNELNRSLKNKLSYQGQNIVTLDFIVSSTDLDYTNYGKAPAEFVQRLTNNDHWNENSSVFVLRSCIWSPYYTPDFTQEDFINRFINTLQNNLNNLL